MKYRTEIDGLRAVAIIPVILFHAGFEYFSGGFVGVDVFFVISGYLITTIILSDMEQGTFSLANFFGRRARRILPALYCVMLVSTPFAWYWMQPSEMILFSQSLVATATFSSNILFWRETGYWGAANELNPLGHTWSLAIEEQFYILFPPFLMLMWRLRNHRILCSLIIIAVLSFIIAQWAAYNRPIPNFYLLPSRAWELAIGALIAYCLLYRKQFINKLLSKKTVNEVLSLAGLLMIGIAVFTFDETVPFPSFYALIPTVGTGLVILFSSKQTVVGRLLSTKALVGVGLISYSAYLWHQPLFAFSRIRMLDSLSSETYIILSILSLVLAYISWRFIENPFRNKKQYTNFRFFSGVVIISFLIIIFGVTGYIKAGFPSRIPEAALMIQNWPITLQTDKKDCADFAKTNLDSTAGIKCTHNPNLEKKVVLWGDSHAQAVSNEFANLLAHKNSSLVTFSKSTCPPVLNIKISYYPNNQCMMFNSKVIQYINANAIDTVILFSRWALYLEGTTYNNKEGGIEPGVEIYALADNKKNNNAVGAMYRKTIEALLQNGIQVILIYPTPEAGWNVSTYLSRSIIFNNEPNITLTTSFNVFQKRMQNTHAQLDKLSENPNLIKIHPENIFCNTIIENRCVTSINGLPLYFDDDHLNAIGSTMLATTVIKNMIAADWVK